MALTVFEQIARENNDLHDAEIRTLSIDTEASALTFAFVFPNEDGRPYRFVRIHFEGVAHLCINDATPTNAGRESFPVDPTIARCTLNGETVRIEGASPWSITFAAHAVTVT